VTVSARPRDALFYDGAGIRAAHLQAAGAGRRRGLILRMGRRSAFWIWLKNILLHGLEPKRYCH